MLRPTLRLLLWTATIAALAGYLFVAFREVRGPRTLDPSERVMLVHAQRLASGAPLFQEPPPTTPTPVLPGFPLALSLAVRAIGARTWEPRAISVAALLACVALLALIVLGETGSRTMAAAGAGLPMLAFASLTPSAAHGQPEALALLLVLSAFLCLRHAGEVLGALLGALLLAGACFTAAAALP